MTAYTKMRFAVLVNLASIFIIVTTSSSKSHFTCHAGTYFLGEEGYVTCHFGRDIYNSTYHLEIVMYPSDGQHSEDGRDVLRCHWLDDKRRCQTTQGFEFDKNIRNNVTVRIPKVTPVVEGIYACQLMPPGFTTSVPCNLQVIATDPTPALPTSDVYKTLALILGVSDVIFLILTSVMVIYMVRVKPLVPQKSPQQAPAVHSFNGVLKTVQEETDFMILVSQEDLDEEEGAEKPSEYRFGTRERSPLSKEIEVVAAVKRIGVQRKLENREFPWDGSVEDRGRHMKHTDYV